MNCQKILRVLKANGIIGKPTNPDVKGVGKREIKRLFPNCSFDFHKVTLVLLIARLIAPWSFLLCYFLELIPWLRTHYLAVIKKYKS